MLVEDRTAFIEQLEVLRPSARAEKHRRRVARAELEILRAEWEVRMQVEMIRALDTEILDAEALSGRRRRLLEKEREAAHERLQARRVDLDAKRERLRAIQEQAGPDEPPRGARMFRLHSAHHHLEYSERRFARLARSQVDLPVLVAKKDGKRWWWYLDRFWWDDVGLAPKQVEAIVLGADLRRSQVAEEQARARSALLEEDRGFADAIVSQIVRFAVWCRDRGRCVDCGTGEDLGFDQIVPWSKAGRRIAANVELRCARCRERRLHNETRARVGRARIDATSPLL